MGKFNPYLCCKLLICEGQSEVTPCSYSCVAIHTLVLKDGDFSYVGIEMFMIT